MVLTCNKEGMDHLRKAQFKDAFEQLKYAEAILVARHGEDEKSHLLAVTCNNLGCYYKKVNKLHAALSYLRKALKIEVVLQTDDVTVAGTHLNICAILSKLDKHDRAVQHACCALDLISGRVAAVGHAATQDENSVLAIAYHNVAVERDYLRDWEAAAQAYQQGHQVAKQSLGEFHPLTQTLRKNSDAALQKTQRLPSRERVTASSGSRLAKPPPLVPDLCGSSAAGSLRGQVVGSFGSLPEIANTPRSNMDDLFIPKSGAGDVCRQAAEWMRSDSFGPTTQHSPPQRGVGMGKKLPPRPTSPARGGRAASAQPPPAPVAVPPERECSPLQQNSPHLQYSSPRQAQWPVGFGGIPVHPVQLVHPTQPAAMHAEQEVATVPAAYTPWARPQASFLEAFAQDPHPSQLPPLARPEMPPRLVLDHERRCSREDRHRSTTAADGAQAGQHDTDVVPSSAIRGLDEIGRRSVSRRGHTPARIQRDLMRSQNSFPATAPPLPPRHSQLLRQSAAGKIQVAWHKYRKRVAADKERAEQERVAATRIQAVWRGFHVRHVRRSRASVTIQRHVRGYLVRIAIQRRRAALALQRHTRGMWSRRELRQKQAAALRIQSLGRCKAAQRYCERYKEARARATLKIQSGIRMWRAKRVAASLRHERDKARSRQRAALILQSLYRGRRGRAIAAAARAERHIEQAEYRAAMKIQATVRGSTAKKQAECIRRAKELKEHRAATSVRKHWLGYVCKRKYGELRSELRMHVGSVVTIQRYARGYLVRLRMWREAIRAEEELWAAVEIQRCWRGHLGRVRWELEYEAVWSREDAARRIQRFVRGWLARTRVHRLRKRKARAEFQKARRRFKAAQKIQALVRGRQARRRVEATRQHIYRAATTIQRHHRGHRIRSQAKRRLETKRVVQIQAAARGYLARKRNYRAQGEVRVIQRAYRHWLKVVPKNERQRRVSARRQRTPDVQS